MSLISMVTGLDRAGVHFVVIGGFAGIAHGSSRVTDDLDVCYDSAPDNLKRLAALLGSWSAYPRGAPRGLPFELDERMLRNAPVLTLDTREGALDIFDRVEGVGDYERCEAASEWVELGSVRFQVLNLDALIAAKTAAGRAKDLEHLKELRALRDRKG